MADEIKFVLDERLNELNSEIQGILYNMKEPLSGERIHILNKFTRGLIQAHYNQSGKKVKRRPVNEALLLTTNEGEFIPPELDIPTTGTEEFTIPTFPIEPQKDLMHESLNLQVRDFQTKKLIEEPKKEIPVVIKEVPKNIDLTEEHVSLIKSQVNGDELASATIKGLFYVVHESQLGENEITILNAIRPLLEKKQGLFHDKEKFTKLMNKTAKKNKVAKEELSPSKLRYFLIKHLVNFGLIDPILNDPKVTKIICGGPNLKIKVQRENKELITNLEYINTPQLKEFIEYFAKKSSKKITEETTTLELEFENFRIHINVGVEGVPPKFTLEKTI